MIEGFSLIDCEDSQTCNRSGDFCANRYNNLTSKNSRTTYGFLASGDSLEVITILSFYFDTFKVYESHR